MYQGYGIMGYESPHERYMREIYDAKRLYDTNLQKLKDQEKYVDLTRRNFIEAIKKEPSAYDYMTDILLKAQEQLLDPKQKRKKEPIGFVNRKISTDFFENEATIKIHTIRWYGFSNYAVIFCFAFEGKEYTLQIPLKNNLDPLNAECSDRLYGKFALMVAEESDSWKVLISAYDMDMIKEYILKNLIKKQEEKNDK